MKTFDEAVDKLHITNTENWVDLFMSKIGDSLYDDMHANKTVVGNLLVLNARIILDILDNPLKGVISTKLSLETVFMIGVAVGIEMEKSDDVVA